MYSSGHALAYLLSGDTWESSSGRVITAELPSDPETLTSFTQLGYLSNVDKIVSKARTYLNYTLFSAQSGTVSTRYLSASSGLKIECKLDYVMKAALATVKLDKTSNIAMQDQYALGAFIGGTDSSLQYAVCTMVKCNASGKKCGEPVRGYSTETVFRKVHLSGSFPGGSEVYASALGSGLELLSPMELSITDNSLSINNHTKPLLCANLWARI